jgi:Ca-activated chloride channel family protein
MNFDAPARLLLIVAPIALLVAYIAVMRARQKYALRFTSVDLLASVAPKRPGWQRHIAAGLILVALILMVVGFAKPTHSIEVPRQKATLYVAIDTSGSMNATDVSPSRLDAAKAAAKRFVDGMPKGIEVGLVAFDRSARMVVPASADHGTVTAGIQSLQASGSTATADALKLALDAIAAQPEAADGKKPPAEIVLLSDGTPTVGSDGGDPIAAVDASAAKAKENNVRIDTIAFGTPEGTVQVAGDTVSVPADPATMQRIADRSGGKSFTAETLNELKSVYDQIRKTVGYDTKQSDLTVWFVGFALVSALLAAAAGLIWSQKLI